MKFKKLNLLLFSSFVVIFILLLKYYDLDNKKIELSFYPFGRNFAFTISDDPDGNTLEKIKPVYDFLIKSGLKTTAAIWLFSPKRTNGIPDLLLSENSNKRDAWMRDSCERLEYLYYMQKLNANGFEIAMHGASTGNDLRKETISAYEKFHEYFGEYPKVNIMHAQNLENVYWGKKIVTNKFFQEMIGLLTDRANIPFSGEDPSSIFFWGDILQSKTKYVRLFGTGDINTLKFNPNMPYHDPDKPYVNYWFSFSDGSNPIRFSNLLKEQNVEKLVKNRGSCIVYTHFAHGFVKNGVLDENFKNSIKRIISEPDGWFVPCSILLDRLNIMKRVFIEQSGNEVIVINLNTETVDGITILVDPNRKYYGSDGYCYKANEEGEIIIRKMKGGQGIVFTEDEFMFNNIMNKKQIIKHIPYLIDFKNFLFIYNYSSTEIEISGEMVEYKEIFDVSGKIFEPDTKDNNIRKNKYLKKHEGRIFIKNKEIFAKHKKSIGFFEKFNMVIQRALLYAKHNEYG